MSIFIPYDITDTITYLSDLFSIDLTSCTAFEEVLLTILSNVYFILFWFVIVYFALKIFNRLWERLF